MNLPLAFMNLSTGEYVLIGGALLVLYFLWGRGSTATKDTSLPKEIASKKTNRTWKGAINYLEELADSKDINTPEVQTALSNLRQLFTAKLGG